MDYEKAYKEALERAIFVKENTDSIGARDVSDVIEYIFSELKESEDEKIRKRILLSLEKDLVATKNSGCNIKDLEECITWLEKQGKSKFEQCLQDGDKIVTNEDGTHFNVSQLERIAKKEPKFKVGNWYQCTKDFFGKGVTFDKNTAYYCAKEGCLQNKYGCHIAIAKDLYNNFKLWDISDAKDGDVLSDGTTIFIFKDLLSDGSVMSYCDYDTDSGESDAFCPLSVNLMCSKITPATKEQRDKLGKAITEAGYKWDANKKELKKIPSFCREHCKGYQETGRCFVDGECQAKKNAEISWSGKDEEMFDAVIADIRFTQKTHTHEVNQIVYEKEIDWLKSLKDRIQLQWKPSEEHMKLLKEVQQALLGKDCHNRFVNFMYELKKLKEE